MTRRILLIVIIIEALTFFLAASLHFGVRIIGLNEPQIIPATIVEGLCAIFLSIAAIAIGTHARPARGITIAAHLFCIAGVLLGIGALAMGRGPTTELNFFYHRTILAVLTIMLIILFTSPGRTALRSTLKVE